MSFIGNDIEFATEMDVCIPQKFANDCSVPVELNTEPCESYLQHIHLIKAELQELQDNIQDVSFFGGSYYRGYRIGGHIHLGDIYNPKNYQRNAMDLLLAVPFAAISDPGKFKTRIGGDYGLLCQERGYHRSREEKEYGFEYRTLPSFPCFEACKAAFAIAKALQEDMLGQNKITNKLGVCEWDRGVYYSHNVDALRNIGLESLKKIWRMLPTEKRDDIKWLKKVIEAGKTWQEEKPCHEGWGLTVRFSCIVINHNDQYLDYVKQRLDEFINLNKASRRKIYLYGRFNRGERDNYENPNLFPNSDRRINTQYPEIGLSLDYRKELRKDPNNSTGVWDQLLKLIQEMMEGKRRNSQEVQKNNTQTETENTEIEENNLTNNENSDNIFRIERTEEQDGTITFELIAEEIV
jgi:hypothetical protein